MTTIITAISLLAVGLLLFLSLYLAACFVVPGQEKSTTSSSSSFVYPCSIFCLHNLHPLTTFDPLTYLPFDPLSQNRFCLTGDYCMTCSFNPALTPKKSSFKDSDSISASSPQQNNDNPTTIMGDCHSNPQSVRSEDSDRHPSTALGVPDKCASRQPLKPHGKRVFLAVESH